MERIRVIMLASAAVIACSSPALAQADANTSGSQSDKVSTDGLDEIIVTAEKRGANLQQVPISITAVTSGALEAAGTSGIRDITAVVPGLTFNATPGTALPYIRGVGQASAGLGIESPVSIYIDGTYLATAAGSLVNLNDVERVEVLKGPQGTLFGRNATGGVIHVITKTPPQDPSFRAEIGYGNYRTVEGRLYAGGTVAGRLRASLAVYGEHQADGFGVNVKTGSDVLKGEALNAHGKLFWDSESGATDVTVNLIYDATKNDFNMGSTEKGSLAEDGVTRYISEYRLQNLIDPYVRTKNYIGSLRISHDLGSVKLVNLSSYHRMDQSQIFNVSNIPGGITNPNTGTTPAASIFDPLIAESRTFTQETQLQSTEDSRIQWVVGAFYMHNKMHAVYGLKPNNIGNPAIIDTTVITKSIAGFAQATMPIGEKTRLTGGLRYTSDKLAISGTAGFGPAATPAIGGIPANVTYNKPTWRLALDHEIAQHAMLYASYNRGYKSGRYVVNNFANRPANPEIIDSYEIGVKSELFDRRLRINLSAFTFDYKNIQLRATLSNGTAALFNAASSTGRGIDIDIQAVPTSGLTLTAGATWMPYAKYKDFPGGTATVPRPTGGNLTLINQDLSGNRMVRAPKLNAVLGVNYEYELAGGSKLLLNATDSYSGSYFWEADNRLKQNSYHNVVASVGWESEKGFSVRGWVHNLANEKIRAQIIQASTDNYYPGEPRTYGVTIGYKY